MKATTTLRFVLGALVFIAPMFAFAGFGVSPGVVSEENAVPGAVFTRTIYLVQGTPTEPAKVHVEIESRDMKDWIALPSGGDFTIPAGVQQFPFPITITIPKGTPLGVYSAFVRIATIPGLAEDSGEVAVALGGRVDVSVTVGDNIVEAWSVKTIDISDITEDDAPSAVVKIENTGNVAAIPDSASFELFDKFGNIRLGFSSVSFNTHEKTPAFSEKEYHLSFPMNIVLAPGEYWGFVRIHDADGTVVRELHTPFNVVEGEGLVLGVVRFFSNQSLMVRVGAVLIVVALALFILLWVIRRRRMPPQVYEEQL